ncbi:MAG TPA: DUF5331 domain-containing protein [Coleofasciculaceae cyanobacterium]
MNVEQFRQTLKLKWLAYYRDNRSWLTKIGIWVDCEGERRPSAGFILATLTVLEPQLTEFLPLIVALSNDPDRIVMALGLNFSPEDRLGDLPEFSPEALLLEELPRGLPASPPNCSPSSQQVPPHPRRDDFCEGVGGYSADERDI